MQDEWLGDGCGRAAGHEAIRCSKGDGVVILETGQACDWVELDDLHLDGHVQLKGV